MDQGNSGLDRVVGRKSRIAERVEMSSFGARKIPEMSIKFVHNILMIPSVRLLFGILLVFASAIHSQRAETPPDPANDPQMLNLLKEARTLIDSKEPQRAIEKCEKVIASFKAFYEGRQEKVYCAQTPAESLGYQLKAAAEMDQGKLDPDKKRVITLSSTWADAYFMRAYALQDSRRIAEAKASVKLALELSPWNSQYLSELGNIYQLEKDWPKAKESFEAAEEHAQLSPDEAKAKELARARRGLAYVLVELEQLDEAEKKYQQCLTANPNDTKAARELEYVRGLRAKGR